MASAPSRGSAYSRIRSATEPRRPPHPKVAGILTVLSRAEEVLGVMRDLRARQVDILTLGQYLRPSARHLPIVRYVPLPSPGYVKTYNPPFRSGPPAITLCC
jgi:lipoate synthase